MTDRNYVSVRVARSRFGYNGETYREGDVLEVHEGALESHPNTLERVEDATGVAGAGGDDGDDDTEGDEEVTIDDLDPHPSDLTIPDLEERIDDVEDVDLLKTIKDAEKATEDRTGAKDALDDRIAELEG